MTSKTDIRTLTKEELEEAFVSDQIPKYRAAQVFNWLYKFKDSFKDMANIPKSLAEQLDEKYYISHPQKVDKLVSGIDGTRKYLFTLNGKDYIESVLMKYSHGYSVCLSSQVGCKMGCTFCASSKAGFSRNLSSGEIIMQMVYICKDMLETDKDFRIGHVVLMGIGEPLDNYDNVVKFIKLCNEKDGFNISYRNISLSTCGLIPNIYKLAEEKLPITLSISLHAPCDSIRSQTMPVNRKYPMKDLIKACRDYTKITGRRISFEYTLIRGVNDSVNHARMLASQLKGMLCHVNLINVNETKENNCLKTSKEALKLFTNELEKCKINVTLRRTLGADIEAACGQLRRNRLMENDT